MFPKANIPVVQLSLNSKFTEQQHYELGQALRPLRESNVLIIASGGIAHNLRTVIFDDNSVAPWALDFQNKFKANLLSLNFQNLINYKNLSPKAEMAVPYPAEHYIPCLYALGLKYDDEDANDIRVFSDEIMYSSLGMLCFEIGGSKNQNTCDDNTSVGVGSNQSACASI